MAAYRFQVGQMVELPPAPRRNIPGGSYVVTKRLPDGAGEPEYRIKSIKEPHEGVACESELK
jgi:hypothetical protein